MGHGWQCCLEAEGNKHDWIAVTSFMRSMTGSYLCSRGEKLVVIRMRTFICSSQEICLPAYVHKNLEHILPRHSEAYNLGLHSTIVAENFHGFCIGMSQLLSGFSLFIPPKILTYNVVCNYLIVFGISLQKKSPNLYQSKWEITWRYENRPRIGNDLCIANST